ncbi:hypothetical protein ACIPPS_27855 [Streptomyces sp. NPDC090127]|uniref:hypothetical protein n=1 Tax=Streptomyces sp. NPDC090127 TaxID=3365953 RepID=UPI0038283143
MRRTDVPYLINHTRLSGHQDAPDQVERIDGMVRVHENFPVYLLTRRHEGPFFSVSTPRAHAATGALVPCTPEECRRWIDAAVSHVGIVDAISAELRAAHARVVAVPWWRPLAARRALDAWEKTRERYERKLRESIEAYAPVGEEIRALVRAEQEKAAERAREQARREAEARVRRARLAERPVWGCYVATEGGGEADGAAGGGGSDGGGGGRQVVHVFRYDVAGAEVPPGGAGDGRRFDLAGLRQAILELNVRTVVWDRAALRKARREAGVGFREWWQELFHESYRTFTAPPPPPRSPSRWGGGGTGTSGSGGYSGGHGGFSCAGGF